MLFSAFDYLMDPRRAVPDINPVGFTKDEVLSFAKMILTIREAEKKLAEGKRDGAILGPVHLGVGQEAVAVGVSHHLKNTDFVFGAHRSHSHTLALGSDVKQLFAEVLGRSTGLSRGMGGSMHLWDGQNGFHGSVPIVAGTVPLAVGAGWAAKLRKSDAVAVAYLGDGAVEEGVVHESLNLARVLSAPVIFVVENNLFASHMHISQRQPSSYTARFAAPNNIEGVVIDGNDVVAVAQAAGKAITEARAGKGPYFVEAITYRWYGHVDWRDDIDVGVNRSRDDLALWKQRDPLERLVRILKGQNIITGNEWDAIGESVNNLINSAWEKACSDPFPSKEAMTTFVYSSLKA